MLRILLQWVRSQRCFCADSSAKTRSSEAQPQVECLEDRLVPTVVLARGVLSIVGTPRSDFIHVSLTGSRLTVRVNRFVEHVPLRAAQAIKIKGLQGNDIITVDSNITLPTMIDGGPGDDRLTGGGGRNVFRGGPGRDWFGPLGPSDVILDFQQGVDTILFATPGMPPQPHPAVNPFLGHLPSVALGAFTDPGLLGTRTDLAPGAPDVNDRRHLSGPIDYSQASNPPTYGPHHPFPLPTGVYTTQQDDADLVHNMEHGHVWISYNPALIGGNLADLQALVQSFGPKVGVVLTPRPQDPTIIALASWAHLQALSNFDPGAIRAFAANNRGHAPEGFITP